MTLDGRGTRELAEGLRRLFDTTDEVRIATAPGRVNLIGEHTDYNAGWALPMAIDRHVRVAFRARTDRRVRIHSTAYGETVRFDLDRLDRPRDDHWIRYLGGMAWAAQEAGLELCGLDCVIDSDIPLGGGLSSSAAVEMAFLRALFAAGGLDWSPSLGARLGQESENGYVGIASGRMDQLASACAVRNHALLLDCRSLATALVEMPAEVEVAILDTGVRRSLAVAGGAYNQRQASCQRAVEVLSRGDSRIRALRDVDEGTLEAARGEMDPEVYRRARHVVEENLRPPAMARALEAGALEEAGELMNASHASLRDLYEVSSVELDRITELARSHPACLGARLTGAGFGGCAVALVLGSGADAFVSEVDAAYRTEFDHPGEIFVSRAVDGARLLDSVDAEPDSLQVLAEE